MIQASFALSVAVAAPTAIAQADPGTFVANLAQKAIDDIAIPDTTEEQRAQRFRELFTDGFDVPLIARFVLGRYWRVATDAERTEYVALFDELVVTTYARRFGDFPGAQFRVLAVSKPNEDGDQVVAVEGTIPAKAPVRLDMRVRSKDGQFKVIDVAVEGVSMAITQRDEFAAVIQRGGGQVGALLASLREKIAKR